MIKCLKCGKELPEDSKFCQYCGSNNVKRIDPQDNEHKRVVLRRCMDCGKELPVDSQFCQYCGSNRVAIAKNEIETTKTQRRFSPVFRVLLIASCIVAICSCLSTIHLYNRNKKYKDIIIKTTEAETYWNFYSDKYLILNPDNEKVMITYKYKNRKTEVIASKSSKSIQYKWGEWKNDEIPLYITYKGKGIEYVKIWDNSDDKVFYIILVGN